MGVDADGNKALVEGITSEDIKAWVTGDAIARQRLFSRHAGTTKPTHMLLFTFPPQQQVIQMPQQGLWFLIGGIF